MLLSIKNNCKICVFYLKIRLKKTPILQFFSAISMLIWNSPNPNYIYKLLGNQNPNLKKVSQNTEETSIIPNENRVLNNIEWQEYEDKYKLSTNLQDISGVKYRFYVTNDLSDNEVMRDIIGNPDNTFTFEEKWEYVFCYGKEVDDFLILDKQKLFALNFSATQELIRKVEQLEAIINKQQKEITKLKLGK